MFTPAMIASRASLPCRINSIALAVASLPLPLEMTMGLEAGNVADEAELGSTSALLSIAVTPAAVADFRKSRRLICVFIGWPFRGFGTQFVFRSLPVIDPVGQRCPGRAIIH